MFTGKENLCILFGIVVIVGGVGEMISEKVFLERFRKHLIVATMLDVYKNMRRYYILENLSMGFCPIDYLDSCYTPIKESLKYFDSCSEYYIEFKNDELSKKMINILDEVFLGE